MKAVQQTPTESRRYRFWQDEPDPMGNTDLCLKGIKKENLSWLPIEKVPVTEYLPFNSLKQIVLFKDLILPISKKYSNSLSILALSNIFLRVSINNIFRLFDLRIT